LSRAITDSSGFVDGTQGVATFMEGDADLVARVRSGDRDSFDELYDTYADDVFSMCLLILGDPAVARAAAGTAFALVARTRLNPLTDPSRLRTWLLELARGSALAWSGSPQARSVPVPHGVSPEEMIEGAVVPAPASLRVGLARTFDRAAIAAADRQPAHLGLRKVSHPEIDVSNALTEIGRAARSDRLVEPALVDVDDSRRVGQREPGKVVPLSRPAPGEWRTRPAITVAAALVLAVAGVTAAVSWPTSSSSINADTFPDVAVVSPSAARTAPNAPTAPKAKNAPAAPASVVPTVAGMFTSVPADEQLPDTNVPAAPSTTATNSLASPSTTQTPTATETPDDPTTEPVPTTEVPTEPEPGPTPTDGSAPPPPDPTTEVPTENPPPPDPTTGVTEDPSQPPVENPPAPAPGSSEEIVSPITVVI
jgi:DNA-directed RNA polymerase specialized sigma24 family protein